MGDKSPYLFQVFNVKAEQGAMEEDGHAPAPPGDPG